MVGYTKGIVCAIVNSDKNLPLLSLSLLSFPPPLCPPPSSPLPPPSPLYPPPSSPLSLLTLPTPTPEPLSAIGLGVTGLFSIDEKQSNKWTFSGYNMTGVSDTLSTSVSRKKPWLHFMWPH